MPNSEKHWVRPFVNGAIASVAAETATFPLDLAKTRLQIQVSFISNTVELNVCKKTFSIMLPVHNTHPLSSSKK